MFKLLSVPLFRSPYSWCTDFMLLLLLLLQCLSHTPCKGQAHAYQAVRQL